MAVEEHPLSRADVREMFAGAEQGQTVSKRDYKAESKELRQKLLEAQVQMRNTDFPVIVLFGGVDGAGKGESANLLSAWMDPHYIVTRAFGAPSQEERERPPLWRFWRDLPPKGHIGLFLSAWYHDPLLRHVYGETTLEEFHERLDRIAQFERTLADDGALILKFWMHLSREAQEQRFRRLEADPLQSWRVTEKDWKHWAMYGKFMAATEHLIARTSSEAAPWTIIEGIDLKHSILRVGNLLRDGIQGHGQPSKRRKRPKLVGASKKRAQNVLHTIDLKRSHPKKVYERLLEKWQGKLNQLQRRAAERGISTILVFEGWDAAGKGGAIRRLVGALEARYYRVIPIAAPTDEERAQHYLWRFWRHLSRAGRVTIFDRSWYGRVLVERVEGFANENEWQRAYDEINSFEHWLVAHGIVMAKFWVHISREEQERRFKARAETPYKRWKLTKEDWRNRERWEEYETAVHDMVEQTSTPRAPWTIVEGDDKRYARIKVIQTVCAALQERLDR